MSQHVFQIDFTVNNDASRAALQEEQREYKVLESLADMVAKKIGATRDQEAQKAKQHIKEIMTAEQIAAEAKIRYIDLANQRAVQAAVQQLDASRKQEQGHKAVAAAAGQVFGSIQNIVGTLGGITSLAAGVGYFAAQFKQVQQDAQKAALEVSGYRGQLKELAGIKGQPNVDSETLRQEMAFRRQTLQTAGDATKLQTSAYGMAAAVVGPDGKLSDSEFNKFLVSSGRLQAIKGVDAAAMGQFAGALALNSKGPATGDGLTRQMMALFKAADLGAMEAAPFAEQFSKSAPLVASGDFASLQDLAAVMSGTSFAGKETTAERMKQLVRLTRGSLGDVSAPPGATMSPAEYYRSIGATDQMDTRRILEMMSGDLKKQEGIAAKGGQKLSIDTYLRERGFGSMEDIGAFKAYYSYRDSINKKFLPTAHDLPAMGEVDRQLNAYRFTPLGMKAQADLTKDQASIAMGAGPGEYADAYRRDLFERLKVRDQGFLAGWKGDFSSSQGVIGGAQFQQAMLDDLRAKGVAAGLPWQVKTFGGGGGMGGSYHQEDPLRALLDGAMPGTAGESAGIAKVITMLAEKGVNPLGSRQMDEATKQQLDIAQKMEKHLQRLVEQLQPPVLQDKAGGKSRGNRLP